MNIEIDKKKKEKLEEAAKIQGRNLNNILEELIDKYLEEFYTEIGRKDELKAIMKVSEPSFEEWDNTEDDVYDKL